MMLIPQISLGKSTKNVHSNDLINPFVQSLVGIIMILIVGLVAEAKSNAASRPVTTMSRDHSTLSQNFDFLTPPQETAFGRRLGSGPAASSQLFVSSRQQADNQNRVQHQTSSQEDLSSADQMDEPTFSSGLVEPEFGDQERIGAVDHVSSDQFSESKHQQPSHRNQQQLDRGHHRDNANYNENDDAIENSHAALDGNLFLNSHNTHLRAMRDMFERRHLDHNNNNKNNNNPQHHHNQHNHNNQHLVNERQQTGAGNPVQSSQELSPIAIGLDPGSPFGMSPFHMGPNDGAARPSSQMSNADNLDGGGGLGPVLPFGLNPLPHLMGFQNAAFDGPQRGDQSAHSNHHAAATPQADTEPANGAGSGQKSWPKIFRFTDGRINLSEFEKQKKIRLSGKHGDNHIESAPIMFDGRPLKRKSFLILHGGVFPGN